jgi:glutathione synthase/RimK-type ligase-like ATP-grasp enzyme
MAAVRAELERQRHHSTFLDQGAVLATDVELRVGASVSGIVRSEGHVIDLAAVSAVYLRPYDHLELPAVKCLEPHNLLRQHARDAYDLLTSWANLTPALVVNRPMADASNSSKPYQAARIIAAGFDVPETLLTTDPEAALQFWDRHRSVIYKSVSGVRSIVARLTPEHVSRLDDIRSCPTQFQAFIPGQDYRVHVVGEDIFACQVSSDADDYRFAALQGTSARIRPAVLPHEVGERCQRLAAALHLHLAGVDLRQTADGEWFCFEVNPSPAFSYYQEHTGQPIDQAIAGLLTRATSGTTPV